VAQRLARLTRQTDTVARVGGDEFVILCTDADPHHALRIAERVVGVMRIPIRHSSGWATIGASVGLAHANEAIDVDELLQTADRALYAAKRAGKGRVAVASQPGPGEGGHGELIAR